MTRYRQVQVQVQWLGRHSVVWYLSYHLAGVPDGAAGPD